MVSELLEGETLRERLAGGAIPPPKAVGFALQIVQGLWAAHQKNIVHRDLKPENLFLTRDGWVKILDFGLAKLIEPNAAAATATSVPTISLETSFGKVFGTVGYMSPEQVRGTGSDQRSDIFSLGVVLYEMLSGERPFERASPVETMNAILKEDPPPLPSDISEAMPLLESIVYRCLEKAPEQRFQTAYDLAFALQSASGAMRPNAIREAAPVGHAPVRYPKTMAGTLAIILLALAFAVYRLGIQSGELSARSSPPSYQRLTFRRGNLGRARFAPDGVTIVYAAAWESSPLELFSTRLGSKESRPLGLGRADILSISSSGEMLILQRALARVPLAGGAPREIAEGVASAAWTPDGKSFAVLRSVNGRDRIEFPIGKPLYESSVFISEIRFSPKGDGIAMEEFTPGTDTGSISIIGLEGRKRTVVESMPFLASFAWSNTGDEIWFRAAPDGNARGIYATDLKGKLRMLARLPDAITVQDISPQGRVLLAKDDGRISLMCLPAGQSKERDLSWFDVSLAEDISADGKTLLITENSEGGGLAGSAYLRKTDGSDAVRLGDGIAKALSPDGRWVLAVVRDKSSSQLSLIPTGAGESKLLERGPVQVYRRGAWFPDGKRILIAGLDSSGPQVFVQEIAGGPPRSISKDCPGFGPISPDGKTIAAGTSDRGITLCDLEAHTSVPLRGVEPGEMPLRWTAAGDGLFVSKREIPFTIARINVSNGARQAWREIRPVDPDLVGSVVRIVISPDGRSYAYSYSRILSTLYVMEGLR
jgi:Tol biopolymer transport system component